MDNPRKHNENAKDKRWKTPMEMESAGKNAYNNTMSQSSGTQDNTADPKLPDDYGMKKNDLGGYIGNRATAANSKNKESMPGGGG
jgi:hypothetical protein